MRSRAWIAGLVGLTLVSPPVFPGVSSAEEPAPPSAEKNSAAEQSSAAASTRVSPKSLSGQVEKGLAYLVSQQHADGGWGQGGGWRQAINPPNASAKQQAKAEAKTAAPAAAVAGGRVEGKDVPDPSDVGSTAIAALALLRAGSSPIEGPYAKNLARAVDYLCRQVEAADAESLYVTDVRDTQLQSKIGNYADTFLAGWLLAEIKGKTKDQTDSRALAALDKVIAKIERHQKADGTFANNQGWAAVHSQGLCSFCLNSAAANGARVKGETLKRDYLLALKDLDVQKGEFKEAAGGVAGIGGGAFAGGRPVVGDFAAAAAAPSNAGIGLYQLSVQNAQLQAKTRSNRSQKSEAEKVLAAPTSTTEQKAAAESKLAEIETEDNAQQAAVKGIVSKLDDQGFVAGFGNNGGEEFLSYMNISASLLVKGGADWKKWDDRMTANLNHVQNGDGSWSGDHCITGRTFCTSAALLTLMADRAPAVELAERVKAGPAPAASPVAK